MLNAKLVVVGGDAKAAEVALRLPTTIGRGRDANLTLPHPLVSRLHCELYERDGLLHVRDLKSLNGTYVNSQRIEGESRLLPEELLTIGNVTFRAVYESATAAALPSRTTSDPGESVIEFEEMASQDADSEIDPQVTVHEKKTTPGRRAQPRPTPTAIPVAAKAAVPDTLRPEGTVRVDDDHVLDDASEAAGSDQPEHSIISAMRRVAGSPQPDRLAADATEQIRKLAAESESRKASLSGIEKLNTGSKNNRVDPDLGTIDVTETIRVKIDENDASLDSFIRKMPR